MEISETAAQKVEAKAGDAVTVAAKKIQRVADEGVETASKKPTGSYTNTHESGKRYHGKRTEGRMNTSAKEKATEYDDPIVEQDFKPAASHRKAFKDEARRIRKGDGVENPNNATRSTHPVKNTSKRTANESN